MHTHNSGRIRIVRDAYSCLMSSPTESLDNWQSQCRLCYGARVGCFFASSTSVRERECACVYVCMYVYVCVCVCTCLCISLSLSCACAHPQVHGAEATATVRKRERRWCQALRGMSRRTEACHACECAMLHIWWPFVTPTWGQSFNSIKSSFGSRWKGPFWKASCFCNRVYTIKVGRAGRREEWKAEGKEDRSERGNGRGGKR